MVCDYYKNLQIIYPHYPHPSHKGKDVPVLKLAPRHESVFTA